jgi:hypothetical protein
MVRYLFFFPFLCCACCRNDQSLKDTRDHDRKGSALVLVLLLLLLLIVAADKDAAPDAATVAADAGYDPLTLNPHSYHPPTLTHTL